MVEVAPSPTHKADSAGSDTVERIVRYYEDSPGYLRGPLEGTCHFGYTEKGEPFELEPALRAMENLLGKSLNLAPGSRVLDAGCGYGRVATTLINQFGYDVIGLDLIGARLREAQRFIADHTSLEMPGLARGNYCALPIKDESFAGIYTMETLVHADPLEDALAEFKRVLEPGGRLVLFEYSIPERESLGKLRRYISDEMIARIGMASIERFTHNAFPELVRKAGFESIKVEDVSHHVWPTWRWMFWQGVRDAGKQLAHGRLVADTNHAASLMIWPYRHWLGYKVVTATKPIE